MTRTAKKPKDEHIGEIKTKDFAGAVRAYRNDIIPALSKVGQHNQEASTAYKHIKKNCHIQPQAAKMAFKLDGMEEAKRDDFLRCFAGLLKELNIPLEPADLVDAMQADDKYARPKLVTVGDPYEGDNTDLAGEGFTEATEAELAMQEGRGGEA